MGSDARTESALETRIRLLRDLERRLADAADAPVTFLAAVRELLMQSEAEADQEGG
jgi:hypothetical protein